MPLRLTASLVLYHNAAKDYAKAIQSFLDGCDGHLVVVDNSATPLVHPLFHHNRVTYSFAGANLGFGRGHNRAFALATDASDLHLVMNPDVAFTPDILPALAAIMAADAGIVAAMPRINYPDGSLQRLAKLLPTPHDLIIRRFMPASGAKTRLNDRYELAFLPQDRTIDVPSLSGCFLLLRSDAMRACDGFDPRYFMYMEDVDLVRRVGDLGRTVYVPTLSIVHNYAKGSYGNRRLLLFHLRSAIAYFQRWGWLRDNTRALRNSAVLALKNAQPAASETG